MFEKFNLLAVEEFLNEVLYIMLVNKENRVELEYFLVKIKLYFF